MDQVFYNSNLQALFDTDGIVQVPFLTTEEVNTLRSLYGKTSQGISSQNFHSTMFIDNCDYRKAIDVGIRKIILPKAEAILNAYRMMFANFIVKEPSAATVVGIHQDWNFTFPELTSVNIWIPLTDIDERTGLFHALKGSHLSFRNIRYTPFPDNAYASIAEIILKHSTPFRIKAGEAVVYHGALVHFTDANVSLRQRLAIGAVFIPKNAPGIHYYKRFEKSRVLEVYKTDESFYNSFDFMKEPVGVSKISEICDYYDLPSEEELLSGYNKV